MTDRMKVAITVESIQDGELNLHTYDGEWFRKDRSDFIRYEEGIEADQIRTLIRFRSNELSITRRGAVQSEQLFVQGYRQAGSYRSAYTSFQLETDTKQLLIRTEAEHDGQMVEPPFTIECKYEIWIGEEMSGKFHIRFHIKPSEVSQ